MTVGNPQGLASSSFRRSALPPSSPSDRCISIRGAPLSRDESRAGFTTPSTHHRNSNSPTPTIMLSQPRLRSSPRPSPPRSSNGSLKLSSLPRFHPANFPSSQHSSVGNTPTSGPSSPPPPPISPRQQHQHQRLYFDRPQQLRPSDALAKPLSPKLQPLGSPGPVTPLMLEDQGGYVTAGARCSGAAQDEVVDRLIREEARRRERRTSAGGR